MRIAIHNSNAGFHPLWIQYCQQQAIPYKLVDCYANNITQQLADCTALMWHHGQGNAKDILVAKQILFSLEHAGLKVFPNFKTSWHFDDKVGQKYLLEAVDAPFVPTYVFFSKKEALAWVATASFPKVFKLRGGAGSANVKLARSRSEAIKLVQQAFGAGFKQYWALDNLKERYRKFKNGKASVTDLVKGVARFIVPPNSSRIAGKEIGYIYFQQFIPNNDADIRVIVINDKAFAIKRMVRENDFRASGSGHIRYNKELFDDATVQLSFTMAERLQSQCLALDFVYDNGKPLIVELSYGFVPPVYEPCEGYWDRDMQWHAGKFNPYGWMVEAVR